MSKAIVSVSPGESTESALSGSDSTARTIVGAVTPALPLIALFDRGFCSLLELALMDDIEMAPPPPPVMEFNSGLSNDVSIPVAQPEVIRAV